MLSEYIVGEEKDGSVSNLSSSARSWVIDVILSGLV